MLNLTNMPPLHRTDVHLTMALTDLMVLRPLMAAHGHAQLENSIAHLKRALATLREADDTLPEFVINDPTESDV